VEAKRVAEDEDFDGVVPLRETNCDPRRTVGAFYMVKRTGRYYNTCDWFADKDMNEIEDLRDDGGEGMDCYERKDCDVGAAHWH